MDGLAVEPDRAGAAIAGVAALLDAEGAVLAQEGAQALPGNRRRGDASAVNDETGGGSACCRSCWPPSRKLGADLFGEVERDVPLV